MTLKMAFFAAVVVVVAIYLPCTIGKDFEVRPMSEATILRV